MKRAPLGALFFCADVKPKHYKVPANLTILGYRLFIAVNKCIIG